MRHWTFWEWVAYLCLLFSAVILAADTGLKIAPELTPYAPFIANPWWGFAPLGLLLIGTIILVANELGWLEPLGFGRKPKFFLERDPQTQRYGIQVFPGITYVQLSVTAGKPLNDCQMWISKVEFRENAYIPFAEINNERHQLLWARPNQEKLDLGPDQPPARVTIAVFNSHTGLIYENNRTPSNLYPLLQLHGTFRFNLVFSGRSNRSIVSARLFFYLDWKGVTGPAIARLV